MIDCARTSRPGFTLIEMGAVVTIAALLAAAVIPSMARIDLARREAAASETLRLLEYARERALASGVPVGVRFDAESDTLTLVTLDDGGRPRTLTDPLGRPAEPTALASFGADLAMVSVPVDRSLGGDPDTVWFDHRAVPHARTTEGDRAGDLDADAQIEISGVGTVTVVARSGLVERP